jgi:hypothetical protein
VEEVNMALASSWIHGNALTMESPISHNFTTGESNGRLVLTPLGWGAEVTVEGFNTSSWMHIPIPTVSESVGPIKRFLLSRVILLFECEKSQIEHVHLYDGAKRIYENDKGWSGSALTKRPYNSFELSKPRQVEFGIGLSFFYVPRRATPDSPARLYVAAAGAEYQTENLFSAMVGEAVGALTDPFFRHLGGGG